VQLVLRNTTNTQKVGYIERMFNVGLKFQGPRNQLLPKIRTSVISCWIIEKSEICLNQLRKGFVNVNVRNSLIYFFVPNGNVPTWCT
jgi:hypothetical protein